MSDRRSIDSTKRHILDHGVALILKQGYHGTGLNEVLAAAKVPKGSFYYYFASKEDFGVQAVEHYIEPFIKELNAHLEAKADGLSAIEAYFKTLITNLESGDFAGGCLLGNLMGEIGDTSEAARTALKKAVDRYRDLLESGLVRAQKEGTVRSDRSARAMADILTNAWQGALLRMKVERSAAPLRAFLDEVLLGYCKK
jgi:TetR/AcrR family transcriptional regulator, transcriptional repressor for nem operon